MAEAAAIVGLVASIATLVDLNATVVSRLREFFSKSRDVPRSFIFLLTRLPALTEALQHIRSQAEAGRLSDNVTKELKAIVNRTSEQVSRGDSKMTLATAGAYLSQSADSFDDYLERYEDSLRHLSQYSRVPVDDPERTLYSTWIVSFRQVRDQDPIAAELLKLMAYLDNQDLWYGLFYNKVSHAPAWWKEVLKSRMRFNQAISTLHNYSLLEVSAGRYSLHRCLHDWTLEYLNHEFDQERCRIAIHCIAANVSAEYCTRNRRVLRHACRFKHPRIQAVTDWSEIEPMHLSQFAQLYQQNDMNAEAEGMSVQALQGFEEARGLMHRSTLRAVHSLGVLYADQGKMDEAEKMYQRALEGFEKSLGAEHTSTLRTVYSLGFLYANQSKMDQAEKMNQRVLEQYGKALGPEHTYTLRTVYNSGSLYLDQSKMDKAEKMYQRALEG